MEFGGQRKRRVLFFIFPFKWREDRWNPETDDNRPAAAFLCSGAHFGWDGPVGYDGPHLLKR